MIVDYFSHIESYRGISPGKFIGRELKKRNIRQKTLAMNVGEHAQTINAIIAGKRNLTTRQALEIEKQLQLPEGFLLILQCFHDIKVEKDSQHIRQVSGVPAVRPILFWDMNFENMDWARYKKIAIQRVMERGNEEEKKEILRFYGESDE